MASNNVPASNESADERSSKRARPPIAESERRTVFLSGVPLDSTPRELRNLFAFAPGFVQVQQQNGKPSNLFALFETQEAALSAVEHLSGYQFAEDCELKPSLAKGNLVKSNKSDMRGPSGGAATDLGRGYAVQPVMSWDYPSYPSQAASFTPSLIPTTGIDPYAGAFPTPLQPQPLYTQPIRQPAQQAKGTPSRNPPCDTLFLRDISASEADVQAVAKSLGSVNHKFMKSSAGLAAFVQFSTAQQATQAISQFKGSICGDVEFSKNPLGKRSRE